MDTRASFVSHYYVGTLLTFILISCRASASCDVVCSPHTLRHREARVPQKATEERSKRIHQLSPKSEEPPKGLKAIAVFKTLDTEYTAL